MAKNNGWQNGTVRWFDDLKGEGLIRDESGNSYYVHYSAIRPKKEHRTLTDGAAVRFKLYVDSHFVQVDRVKEV